MDFVIKKLNARIKVSEEKSVERQTLLRERIEYMLFQAFGVLWNENINEIGVEKRKNIVINLQKISIGHVVEAIRNLDVKNDIILKKQFKVLDKYPELRNQALGHGYTHEDEVECLEKNLEGLYQDLMQINFFANSYDIIEVTKCHSDSYEGIRYIEKEVGELSKWMCQKETLGENVEVGDIYLLNEEMRYYKISPFIYVTDKGESVFVFQSLEDKLSGSIKLNRLFRSEMISKKSKELICISEKSKRRKISSNGTIMNDFNLNYRNYISMPIEEDIKNFLNRNRSNVLATIWGHGGVGKTASIQNVCMDLFNKLDNEFSYIVFVSAKDRRYDIATGNIKGMKGIRTYQEVLDNLISVIFDKEENEELSVKEQKVIDISDKTLLVIDDYETFSDEEKEKIQNFIHRLNIDYFKVIITTRNKRFSSGIELKIDEFNELETQKFLLDIFKKDYPQYYQEINDILSDGAILSQIYDATSGRALFLYQFANLYAQKGLESKWIQELKQSDNAKEFLYGRIYDYLGDIAKKEFMIISQIVDENDMIFKEDIVLFILNEEDDENVEEGLQELVEQKIVEKYDQKNYRVYSKEMVSRMQKMFNDSSEKFKDHVKNRLKTIGGSKIKGTVYEAMLSEANASRNLGNVKDTLQRYKQILNDKKCDKKIKRKALLNLTSYISISLVDNEQTIKVFDDYVEKLGFQNDVEVMKMYVQYLWRSDNVAKEKACDLLDRFFRNKGGQKVREPYFELFTLATNYLCHNVLENTPEKVICSAENRIINEYSLPLYNHVIEGDFNEYKPAIRHNVSIALIATLKVTADLKRRGYDKRDLNLGIKEFGEKYFNEIFRNQLKRIEFASDKTYDGEIVNARISYIARYGVLVEIEGIGKAIIHNTEMERGQRNNMRIGTIIKAKVIGQNEKGYILTTKNL